MSPAHTDGWNHNAHYHRQLLAAGPRPCRRALDVGCGLGTFARRLSTIAETIEALDGEPGVIDRARGLSAHAPNVRFIHADFMTWAAGGRYDFISMIAVLHHLPFREALTRAVTLLEPGGVLAVLGLDRAPSLAHAAARSAIAHPVSAYHRVLLRTSAVGAPIREPTMTLPEIREQASSILSNPTVRQHLLWRYSLIWTKS